VPLSMLDHQESRIGSAHEGEQMVA
jgi:hypothetical protein